MNVSLRLESNTIRDLRRTKFYISKSRANDTQHEYSNRDWCYWYASFRRTYGKDSDFGTGILGRGIVDELSKHPEEWKEIYAMSRSKKGSFPPRVKHSHLDLTASADDMAEEVKDINAEYVFFAAYLDAGDADENTRVNGKDDSLDLTTGESDIKSRRHVRELPQGPRDQRRNDSNQENRSRLWFEALRCPSRNAQATHGGDRSMAARATFQLLLQAAKKLAFVCR